MARPATWIIVLFATARVVDIEIGGAGERGRGGGAKLDPSPLRPYAPSINKVYHERKEAALTGASKLGRIKAEYKDKGIQPA